MMISNFPMPPTQAAAAAASTPLAPWKVPVASLVASPPLATTSPTVTQAVPTAPARRPAPAPLVQRPAPTPPAHRIAPAPPQRTAHAPQAQRTATATTAGDDEVIPPGGCAWPMRVADVLTPLNKSQKLGMLLTMPGNEGLLCYENVEGMEGWVHTALQLSQVKLAMGSKPTCSFCKKLFKAEDCKGFKISIKHIPISIRGHVPYVTMSYMCTCKVNHGQVY